MTNKPSIEPTANGPYRVQDLNEFSNSKGETMETQREMYLCRCGGSSNKPFCDGTHVKNGFLGEKSPDRVSDSKDTYTGKEITVHDNRGVCAHSSNCTDSSPSVFKMDTEPWIDADGGDAEGTAATIKTCPSGALSYTRDGVVYRDQSRDPAIMISKDGPHRVVGSIELVDPEGSTPESGDHYTLCRCGASKNKPFCSGEHWHIGFTDDKN